MKLVNKRFLIPGRIVLDYWDTWQANKGRRGFNTILVADMREVKSRNGIVLDYLAGISELKVV